MKMCLVMILVKKVFIFSKTMIICLLCPLLCGLFFFWKGAKGELSYKVKKENQVFDSLHTFIIAFIIHFICPKQPLHSTLQAVLPQADQSDKYHDKITTSRIPQNISSYIQQKSHSNECFPVLHSESEMR
ncbi:Uncharacterised protein [Anaerostipes hadrus]|nr:Uncharacterised protein [Anaerostipes hadrus]